MAAEWWANTHFTITMNLKDDPNNYLVFVEAIYKKNHMPNSQLQSSSIMHSMALASYLPM